MTKYWILLKALWGGQHRRPSIYARHTVAGRRKEACNTRSIGDCWKQSSRGVAKSRAKHENLIQNECENRSDAKQSLQEEPFSAQSVKTIIFCTAQDGNTPPKRRSWSHLGHGKFVMCMRLAKFGFQKCAPCIGGEHIFIKFAKVWRKIVSRMIKNKKKSTTIKR